MEKYNLITLQSYLKSGGDPLKNTRIFDVYGSSIGTISDDQYTIGKGMTLVRMKSCSSVFSNNTIFVKPCKECGMALNEDELCPICDNYLYDHED